MGAAGALPRGGAGRGDAPGPRRPRRRGRAGTRSVVLAHAFVAGARSPATPSATSASAASRWCRPSRLRRASTTPRSATCTAGTRSPTTVRYSGSPLAYSFSEADQRKGSWLVDLGADGRRPPPSSSRRRSPGRWPGSAAPSTTCSPTPRSPRHESAWVQATLTDDVRPLQAMERLRARFPHTLVLGFEPAVAAPRTGVPVARAQGRSDHDDRPRLRRRAARRRRPPTPSRRCCATPSTPAARTPTSTSLVSDAGGALMRLHYLEITAFGPFAETVDGRLRPAVRRPGCSCSPGRPGPARRSVLDAVCFALYGDVPGDRSSRQAAALRPGRPPGWRPRVVLEATLAGRRFRITRSPAWERPKKRGTGTTTEQASVTIAERVDGAWVPLSNRLDETGHLVTGLVGMNVAQFTQVAMLPQGRFQAFLRARSEERHRLLQQLFRTGRFEDVERWLREHASRLRRRSEPGTARSPGWSAGSARPPRPRCPTAGPPRPARARGSGELPAGPPGCATTPVRAAHRRRRAPRRPPPSAETATRATARDAGRAAAPAAAAGSTRRAPSSPSWTAGARRTQPPGGRRSTLARRAAAVAPLHRLATARPPQRDRAVRRRSGRCRPRPGPRPAARRPRRPGRRRAEAPRRRGRARALLPREAGCARCATSAATRSAARGRRGGLEDAARQAALPGRDRPLRAGWPTPGSPPGPRRPGRGCLADAGRRVDGATAGDGAARPARGGPRGAVRVASTLPGPQGELARSCARHGSRGWPRRSRPAPSPSAPAARSAAPPSTPTRRAPPTAPRTPSPRRRPARPRRRRADGAGPRLRRAATS